MRTHTSRKLETDSYTTLRYLEQENELLRSFLTKQHGDFGSGAYPHAVSIGTVLITLLFSAEFFSQHDLL